MGREGRRENRKGGRGGGRGRVIEREGEERDDEGWSMVVSGETNGPAWRDSSQSIIFKQKQGGPGEYLRSAYLIKSPSAHIYGPSSLQILTFVGPGRPKTVQAGTKGAQAST